eukprot:5375912-Pleurochrysis_carterae.AAC.2
MMTCSANIKIHDRANKCRAKLHTFRSSLAADYLVRAHCSAARRRTTSLKGSTVSWSTGWDAFLSYR